MPRLPISNMGALKRRPQALPPNAMLEQTEPSHWRLFWPMGEPMLVQTNDPDLLAAADDAFGRYETPVPGQAQPIAQAQPLVLTLFTHDVGAEPESWQSDGQPRPIYRTHDNLFYITLGAHNTATADLARGRAFGFFSRELVRERALVRYIFIEGLAFAMLGPARQVISCHAACVVKEGRGIILYGQAGRGKSTLAYACAKQGFRFLSEDAVFLSGSAGEPRLWGVPWKLHLLPDAKRLFPELADEQPRLQINGEWKLEMEMEQLVPGSPTTCALPGFLIFLERQPDAGPTRVERLSAGEARAQLEIIWPWWVGWTDEMEQRLPLLWQEGAYRLWMNGSPQEAVKIIDGLSL